LTAVTKCQSGFEPPILLFIVNNHHTTYVMGDWSCLPAVFTWKLEHKNTGIGKGRKKWHHGPMEMHTPLVGLEPIFPH
jgi:hypothetical protein